jgi:hypothetical protein
VTFVARSTHDGFQFAVATVDNHGNPALRQSMKRLQRLLPLVLLVALAGASGVEPAGPTYRIVGPDGKITYSDRKPTDPQLKTRQLGQTVSAPLLTPGNEPFDLHPQPAGSRLARPGPSLGEGLAPPVDISGRPFAPGLPDAVFDVIVHQFFVQTLVETCSRVRPAFSDRYLGTVRNWRDRNADILARSGRITFTRFTAEQRDILRSTGRARLQQLLPPPDASEADKMQWCDRTSTDLARHQMELVGDARVAPIVDFEMP